MPTHQNKPEIVVVCQQFSSNVTNNETWRVTAYSKRRNGVLEHAASLEVEFTIDGDLIALIDDVNTIRRFQQKGFATALFDALNTWPQTRGLVQSLCVYNDNHVAKALYEKLGFALTPSCAEMHMGIRQNTLPTRPMIMMVPTDKYYPDKFHFVYGPSDEN